LSFSQFDIFAFANGEHVAVGTMNPDLRRHAAVAHGVAVELDLSHGVEGRSYRKLNLNVAGQLDRTSVNAEKPSGAIEAECAAARRAFDPHGDALVTTCEACRVLWSESSASALQQHSYPHTAPPVLTQCKHCDLNRSFLMRRPKQLFTRRRR
jgi:hypothetical protein